MVQAPQGNVPGENLKARVTKKKHQKPQNTSCMQMTTQNNWTAVLEFSCCCEKSRGHSCSIPPSHLPVLYQHLDIPREDDCRTDWVRTGSLQLPKRAGSCTGGKFRTRLSLTTVIQKKHRAGNNTAVQQKSLLQIRKY